MQHSTHLVGFDYFEKAALAASLFLVAACATSKEAASAPISGDEDGPQWAAYGYIGMAKQSEDNLIDVFASRDACDAAVDAWTSRQVAGALVWGECLPVDPQ